MWPRKTVAEELYKREPGKWKVRPHGNEEVMGYVWLPINYTVEIMGKHTGAFTHNKRYVHSLGRGNHQSSLRNPMLFQ